MTWGFHTTHRSPGPWANGRRCLPDAISRRFPSRSRRIRQHLPQRVFVLGDAVPNVPGRQPVFLQPGANAVTTGHQGRTRRHAFRFDVVVRESKTLVGEAVDFGRRRSAQHTSAVHADFSITEIVHQDEDDVRLARIPGSGQERRSAHHDRKAEYGAFSRGRKLIDMVTSCIRLSSDMAGSRAPSRRDPQGRPGRSSLLQIAGVLPGRRQLRL